MRAHTTAAAVRAFGLRRALQAFRSPAFEALMDQEINATYCMKDQFQIATKATDEMLRKVEVGRAAEGGS